MNKIQKHLSVPENRIKYCYHFLNNISDFDTKKCYDGIAEWMDKVDTSEAHY